MSKHLQAISQYDIDEYEKAKLRALVLGYFYVYSSDTWHAIDVERNFEIELKVKPYAFVGKIDTLVTDDGCGLAMLEHKTTVTSLEDLNSPYFRKLSYDLQINAYHMAQFLMEEELEQTIYDVIHKPRIKPKKLTAKAAKEINDDGDYCGVTLKDPELVEVGQVETPALFETRLWADILENPRKYYLRYGGIKRTPAQCVETYEMLNGVAEDIVKCLNTGSWYQNSSACGKYGVPCEYMSLCCGTGDPSSDHWKKRKGSDISGEHNLSVSRIHCFFECQRKYYWRYVEGIQRNWETPLALSFGSAFHECLESFWKSTMKENEDE